MLVEALAVLSLPASGLALYLAARARADRLALAAAHADLQAQVRALAPARVAELDAAVSERLAVVDRPTEPAEDLDALRDLRGSLVAPASSPVEPLELQWDQIPPRSLCVDDEGDGVWKKRGGRWCYLGMGSHRWRLLSIDRDGDKPHRAAQGFPLWLLASEVPDDATLPTLRALAAARGCREAAEVEAELRQVAALALPPCPGPSLADVEVALAAAGVGPWGSRRPAGVDGSAGWTWERERPRGVCRERAWAQVHATGKSFHWRASLFPPGDGICEREERGGWLPDGSSLEVAQARASRALADLLREYAA